MLDVSTLGEAPLLVAAGAVAGVDPDDAVSQVACEEEELTKKS